MVIPCLAKSSRLCSTERQLRQAGRQAAYPHPPSEVMASTQPDGTILHAFLLWAFPAHMLAPSLECHAHFLCRAKSLTSRSVTSLGYAPVSQADFSWIPGSHRPSSTSSCSVDGVVSLALANFFITLSLLLWSLISPTAWPYSTWSRKGCQTLGSPNGVIFWEKEGAAGQHQSSKEHSQISTQPPLSCLT